jgi:hypothetical protein
MPDQIGDYYTLNKLQAPAHHGWKLQKITRDYVDGDAWQKTARRAVETVHPCAFFAATALGAAQFAVALYEMEGLAGLSMVCDGIPYDEILIVAVRDVRIQPLQRHSRCIAADGSLAVGGVGGRVIYATIVVGRSNQPDE